jgi:hypothetical protein
MATTNRTVKKTSIGAHTIHNENDDDPTAHCAGKIFKSCEYDLHVSLRIY